MASVKLSMETMIDNATIGQVRRQIRQHRSRSLPHGRLCQRGFNSQLADGRDCCRPKAENQINNLGALLDRNFQ
jgi:hypothetical protein